MEELQSTEILDREILEDARKKALRALKTADDTVQTQTKEWEKKTAASIAELDKKYNEQKEEAAEKVMARLPIDKRRTKVEKIENLLKYAVESWYNSLSRARILELLVNELKKRISLCEEFSNSTQKSAFYRELDKKEAETVLKNANVASCTTAEEPAAGKYPSIILETGSVRVTSSIQDIVNYLLQEKRAELVEALVGTDFMEGEF